MSASRTDYVCRVTQPGAFIAGPPDQTRTALIEELVLQMVHANIALNLFHEALAAINAFALAAMRPQRLPLLEHPSQLITQKPILCARMFVFALDHLGRALERLAEAPGAPQGLAAIHRDFMGQIFTGLKGVRDSAHHRDERLMGRARKKPIQPHAVDIPGGIKGTAILVENLVGTKFTCTSETGAVVEVDVSLASLQKAEAVVQDVLNQFKWTGFPIDRPG